MTDAGSISAQVISEITGSDFGIAYFSEPVKEGAFQDNPNVLFEAGMMQALTNAAGTLFKGWIPIRESEKGWHVYGIAIERTAKMTNWGQYEAAARFQRVLEAMGITRALEEAGVQEDDTVFIGDVIELNWSYEYFPD